MNHNEKIIPSDLVDTLQSDPEALQTLVSLIESGGLTVDQVSTYAAMLPKTKTQIEYSLVLSFNEIHQQSQLWMKLDDVISHIRASDGIGENIDDAMIEYVLDNSRYIDHSFLYGIKYYRMKSLDIEFDAVDIFWGHLVQLLGRQEANRLFMIAQSNHTIID